MSSLRDGARQIAYHKEVPQGFYSPIADHPAVYGYGQRSADKMAAYFFALEEIVVNLSLVFCSV